jgi:hypothetical protein
MAQTERSPFPYSITNALFIPTDGNAVNLVVIGSGFMKRAIPLAATVGSQRVENISIRSDGTSFSGRLQRPPAPGDRLSVGYMDAGLQPTPFVYRGGDPRGGGPPRVA